MVPKVLEIVAIIHNKVTCSFSLPGSERLPRVKTNLFRGYLDRPESVAMVAHQSHGKTPKWLTKSFEGCSKICGRS